MSEDAITLLKASDVARLLKISRGHAYQLLADGEIATVRLGRSVRVRPIDLERYIVLQRHPARLEPMEMKAL